MVVAVSVVAAVVWALVFGISAWWLRRRGAGGGLAALAGSMMAANCWIVVVAIGRILAGVSGGDAVVHHVYVLAVVGVPLVGVGLLADAVVLFSVRRRRWTGPALGALMLVPALIGVWATHVEPERLRVDRVEVRVDPVAGSADGTITVGVIADIQTDTFGDYELRAIERMLAEEPDVILVAGDVTQLAWDDYLRIRSDGVAMLSRLAAPSGVVSIQGNTDPGPLEFAAFSTEASMTPLLDEVLELRVKGRTLRVGGLAWPNSGRSGAVDFVQAFAASATSSTVDVLLAHSPDAVSSLDDASTLDLVVSGHTHGGQFAVPLWGPIWNNTDVPRNVAAGGLHELRGAPVYVSTGVGLQRGDAPKARFLTRPSIGVITIP